MVESWTILASDWLAGPRRGLISERCSVARWRVVMNDPVPCISSAQCPGLLLPAAPLDPESGYSCDQCGHEEAWDKVDTDLSTQQQHFINILY